VGKQAAGVRGPTPYAGVNAVLSALLAAERAVLGEQFVALYAGGSLAGGDFDPERSDIDFVVVTAGELAPAVVQGLQVMHARLRRSGLEWATRIEGGYIPRPGLRRYDPAQARYPWLGVDGHFAVEPFDHGWVIQLHVLREHGLVVAGPNPRTLIDPISPDDLRDAQRAMLREWWQPQLDDHSRLRSREYQAYAVLTMCRALYTLEHGTVVTKAAAARWAQETLGERRAALIERALAWPRGAQVDELRDTLDLIRYTLYQAL
jgi:hypothetical protein